MRFLVFSFFLLLSWGGSIDKKIQESKVRYEQKRKELQGINIKLDKLAKEIQILQRDLKAIDKAIQKISQSLEETKTAYQMQIDIYHKLQSNIASLHQKKEAIQQELLVLISNTFAKSLLLSSLKTPQPEDVINEEILLSIQRYQNGRIQTLSQDYNKLLQELKEKEKRVAELKKKIAQYLADEKRLQELKSKREKSLAYLKKSIKLYNKEKEKIIQEQKALQYTLKKLQIIKEQQNKKYQSQAKKVKVKTYGENYKSIKAVPYRGPKTIPPLEKFVIIKKFGVYTDPIYGIKIPNENIELKPLVPNAKVRNVLNGKVILAKWTPHLRNVVIVQHPNGLFTIYAYIDKLSPFVKPGRKIKKGYILGRVNTKLIFEVTKNNAHINPLDLIQVH